MFSKIRIVGLLICALLSVSNVLAASKHIEKVSEPLELDLLFPGMDANGPTVKLACVSQGELINSSPDFMYFVPLISPVDVAIEISKNNKQRSSLILCSNETTEKTFSISCEFEMRGEGSYKTILDPAQMVQRNLAGLKDQASMKNILEYIEFQGEGFGLIEIEGIIENGVNVPKKVCVHFDGRDNESPVTAGLYSIKPIDGKYEYENRYNSIVARVNELTFVATDGEPKMGIQLSSISKAGGTNGFWSRCKAAIANLFIPPLRIARAGNNAMLNFGVAIYEARPTYTFPTAANIKSRELK